jgi:TPR repeat protein
MDLALQLTIASSEQSSKFGNYMLGFFISGLGNIDEALSIKYGMKAKREAKLDAFYLSAASDQGRVEGRNELAYHLQHKEASRDRERAFQLYSEAASFGHPGANESVGYFLMRGVGTTMDKVAAARYLNIAADAGCLGALRLLLELGDPSRDVSTDMVRARF